MPVCVHCARPISALLVVFGAGHVVPARCGDEAGAPGGCDRVADPYVEHGLVVLVIDVVRTSSNAVAGQSTCVPPYLVQYVRGPGPHPESGAVAGAWARTGAAACTPLYGYGVARELYVALLTLT